MKKNFFWCEQDGIIIFFYFSFFVINVKRKFHDHQIEKIFFVKNVE